MPGITIERMRADVIEGLTAMARSSGRNVGVDSVTFSNKYTGEDNGPATEFVEQIFFEFCLKRIIYPNIGSPSYSRFYLTDYGKKYLLNASYSVYDSDKYLSQLKSQITTLDPLTQAYLTESVNAFNYGLWAASAVMLGCASESIILDICDAFDLKYPSVKVLDTIKIKKKFESLMEKLKQKEVAHTITFRDKEWSTNLTQLFNNIRLARNDAGQPAIKSDQTESDCYANLLLFPGYAKVCYSVLFLLC